MGGSENARLFQIGIHRDRGEVFRFYGNVGVDLRIPETEDRERRFVLVHALFADVFDLLQRTDSFPQGELEILLIQLAFLCHLAEAERDLLPRPRVDPEGNVSGDILPEVDILYMTRVQKERFSDLIEYEKVKNTYVLRNAMLDNTKDNLRVLHPLPRVGEIDPDVDANPKAYYFKQAENGVYTRMAIIASILGVK